MKRAWFFLFVLLLSGISFAASVNVNVRDVVSLELKESHKISGALVSSTNEIYDSGSSPYLARLKLSLYNGSVEVFSGWSKAEEVMPGERKYLTIYAYPQVFGNLEAKISGHYANDASGLKEYNITVENSSPATTKIIFSNPRVYDRKITLSVMSDKDVNRVLVLPSVYPKAWIFEQREVAGLPAGKEIRIIIPYDAGIFLEKQVSFVAISEDGSAFGEVSFPMKKEAGISKYIALLRDWLLGAG